MQRILIAFVACGLSLSFGSAAQGVMTTTFQVTGNVGYELVGFAQPGQTSVSGNVQLMTVPPTATILNALVYTNDFLAPPPGGGPNGGGGWLDGTITDPSLVPSSLGVNVAPTSQDPGSALVFGYQFGAAGAITTTGQYSINLTASFAGGNPGQMHGAALLVIYQDATLPVTTITVNDGVQYLDGVAGNTNRTTTFAELTPNAIGSGTGALSLFTLGDDPFTSGEQIKLNNQVLATNIDSNLGGGGGSASLYNFDALNASAITTVGGGGNTVELTSTGDVYSWSVAVLQSPVPEPSTIMLAILGLLGLLGYGRRRHRATYVLQ
jgi:hypothetical protein